MPRLHHKNYTAPPEPQHPAIPAVLYFFGGKVQRLQCHCWECCPGCLDCPGLQLVTEDGYMETPHREEKTVRLAHLFGGSDE